MAKKEVEILDVHTDMYETAERTGAAILSVVMSVIGTVIMLLLAGFLGGVLKLWIPGLIICILMAGFIIFWMFLTLLTAIKIDTAAGIITQAIILLVCTVFVSVLGCYFPYQYQKPGEYDHVCDVVGCGYDADGGYIKPMYGINRKYYCEFHYTNGAGAKRPTKSDFTNKYGTPTTKCYISGCTNYIAKSGDTNCCTYHSNNCLNCHCYIDSDAMYCLDCLEGWSSGK